MKLNLLFQMKRRSRNGQALPVFVLFIVILILMVGLGIDLGYAYITKAQLSKAVDAACLAGISNLSQGNTTASSMAASTFKANYGRPARDTASVTPVVTIGTSASGNPQVTVTGTTQINTFFLRILPQWKTMRVSETAQATRARLIMTLVLDRSGSMDPDDGTTKGGKFLPKAVVDFINLFDDSVDQAAVVTFSSTSRTNVAMVRPFKAPVTTVANNMLWAGGTFSHGGLSNAFAINNGIAVPSGQDAIKVVVFFTDGKANMIQTKLSCPGANQAWNIGGRDDPKQEVAFFNPAAAYTKDAQETEKCDTPECCDNQNFPSINGTNKKITTANLLVEADLRCVEVANAMRASGMYVFAIGLSNGNLDEQKTFLRDVANDPDSTSFNPKLPVGTALVTGNGAQVPQLFQQVAADILLRLTR